MIDQVIHNIHPLSLPFWHQLYLNLTSLVRSFFATYGYMTVPLEAVWYMGVWVLGALGLAGWGRLLYRPGRDWLMSPAQGRLIGLMGLGAVLSWAVTLIRQARIPDRHPLPGALYLFHPRPNGRSGRGRVHGSLAPASAHNRPWSGRPCFWRPWIYPGYGKR